MGVWMSGMGGWVVCMGGFWVGGGWVYRSWPFRVEWTSIGAAIRFAPRVHSDTFYSSLRTVQGSGALLSINLEEALYKFS